MEHHTDPTPFNTQWYTEQEQHPLPPCDSIRQMVADLQAQGLKRHRLKRTAGEEEESTQVGTCLRHALHKELVSNDAKL